MVAAISGPRALLVIVFVAVVLRLLFWALNKLFDWMVAL